LVAFVRVVFCHSGFLSGVGILVVFCPVVFCPVVFCPGFEFYNDIARFLCNSTAFWYRLTISISDRSNAEITHTTLVFAAVTENHGDSRKSRHTTRITVKLSHGDREHVTILQR